MKTYPIKGDANAGKLGVELDMNENWTKLTIVSPCCRSYTNYKGEFKVTCNNCGDEYDGYSDNTYPRYGVGIEAQPLKEWLSIWLKIDRDNLEVTVT